MIPQLARALENEGVEFWWDERIEPGTVWREEIETEINRADIAILLISQGFLYSQFIRNFELPRIEERVKEGKLIIIPILVGYCDWQSLPYTLVSDWTRGGLSRYKSTLSYYGSYRPHYFYMASSQNYSS